MEPEKPGNLVLKLVIGFLILMLVAGALLIVQMFLSPIDDEQIPVAEELSIAEFSEEDNIAAKKVKLPIIAGPVENVADELEPSVNLSDDVDINEASLLEESSSDIGVETSNQNEDFYEPGSLPDHVTFADDDPNFSFDQNYTEEVEIEEELPEYEVIDNDGNFIGEIIVESELNTEVLVNTNISGVVYGVDTDLQQIVIDVGGELMQIKFDGGTSILVGGSITTIASVDFFDVVNVSGQTVSGGVEVLASLIEVVGLYNPAPEL